MGVVASALEECIYRTCFYKDPRGWPDHHSLKRELKVLQADLVSVQEVMEANARDKLQDACNRMGRCC